MKEYLLESMWNGLNSVNTVFRDYLFLLFSTGFLTLVLQSFLIYNNKVPFRCVYLWCCIRHISLFLSRISFFSSSFCSEYVCVCVCMLAYSSNKDCILHVPNKKCFSHFCVSAYCFDTDICTCSSSH